MNVFLTGVTGFLGGELAVLLSKDQRIGRIYCLVREYDGVEPTARLRQVFDFHADAFDESRIIPIFGDLKDRRLAAKLAGDERLRGQEARALPVGVLDQASRDGAALRADDADPGQLAGRGLTRALALPGFLLSRKDKPTAIFAPNPAIKKADRGILYAYIRPLATIEPLAIRLGMPVDIDWGMKDIASLARHLLAQADGTYVVAWEHHYGEDLARLLLKSLKNTTLVPQWQSTDFDSIYVVRISSAANETRRAEFSVEHEGLNGLPEVCPQVNPQH